MKGTVLLVEDSDSLASLYAEYLRSEKFSVALADSIAAAKQHLVEEIPNIILLDLRLPDGDGLELLTDPIPDLVERTSIIVITAHGSVESATRALHRGVRDYLEKPFDKRRLIVTVKNAMEQSRLSKTIKKFEATRRKQFFGFVGSSLPMQAIYQSIENAAKSIAPVFISGESGTGKELCADALHRCSARSSAPFVAINCAAIPRDLMESEIFGHVKGAFTGAVRAHEGVAVRAHTGTLFLDEICEMDLALQVKLLRFLQNKEVLPVGASSARQVDVHVVCATNRNPLEEVRSGRFREDLYYRLHVIPISLPPLRERGRDVVEISLSLLAKISAEEGSAFSGFDEEACLLLKSYSWPGNVRELQNIIRRVVVLSEGDTVTGTMLKPLLDCEYVNKHPRVLHFGQTKQNFSKHDVPDVVIHPLHETERKAIMDALDACGGEILQAAVLLEISPSTIYRKLKQWEDGGHVDRPQQLIGS